MAEWVRETLWRQGHLLDADAIGALGLGHTETHGCIIGLHLQRGPGPVRAASRRLPDLGGPRCLPTVVGKSFPIFQVGLQQFDGVG